MLVITRHVLSDFYEKKIFYVNDSVTIHVCGCIVTNIDPLAITVKRILYGILHTGNISCESVFIHANLTIGDTW